MKNENKKLDQTIKDLARFPEENTNPVYRVSKDGVLLYANRASVELILESHTKIGHKIPEKWMGMISGIYNSGKKNTVELEFGERTFSFEQIPILDKGYINVYAIDITERKKAEEALKKKMADLELFHKLTVDRELKMIDMKKEVNKLSEELGRPKPYL